MVRKILTLFALLVTAFSSKAVDLAMSTSLNSPASGCELSANTSITVTITSLSGTYGAGYQVGYSLNGGPWIMEPVVTPIYVTFIYTFTAQGDFSNCQVHSVECAVFAPGDTNPANDSQTFSVTSDCAPTTGSITTAPTEVCAGLNSGNLELTGYNGTILNWIYSTDGGISWSVAGNAPTQPYLNIIQPMEWAVVVGSPYGLCPETDTTAWIHIDAVPQTIAGNLPADFDICDNGNGGTLNLTGYLGTILGWEYSEDGGTTWNPITGTATDTYDYLDLTTTTQYQVQVQNGICPAVYTVPVTLTLIPGSDAGGITGESLVCNYENDSFLVANPVNGSVIGWSISTDDGITWTPTGVTGPIYDYVGLNDNTLFAAEVQVGGCPVDVAYHGIIVLPLAVSAGPDVDIVAGDSTQLNATGGSYFSWTPAEFMSDATIYNPVVWPMTTTTYTVSVTDVNGCSDTASVTITVLPDLMTLQVPNLLTPNGDGLNDMLVIENIESYPKNEIIIFNSYGQIIFQASPYDNNWTAAFQGAAVPDGTYFYVLDLNDDNPEQMALQGVITVMGNE